MTTSAGSEREREISKEREKKKYKFWQEREKMKGRGRGNFLAKHYIKRKWKFCSMSMGEREREKK